jgi:outer membrane protein insertion porin family
VENFITSKESSNIISEVLIMGLKNVKIEHILSVVNLRKGSYYSDDLVKNDVYSILKLGSFDNVKFKFDNNSGKLVYIVVEKPYIKSVIFKGNSKFSDKKLKNLSVLKEKTYYDISKLEGTKRNIEKLYIDSGYFDCKVEAHSVIDTDVNKIVITFFITENNKIVICDIDIKGSVYFRKNKILKFMKMRPKKIFKEDIYKNDLELIKNLYMNNGFIDCNIVSSTMYNNDSKTKISLKLNIIEGMRYKIDSVTYNGNLDVSGKEIKNVIKIKKGQIFNQNKVVETIKNISKIYSDKGYLHSEIVPLFNKACHDGNISINFLIKENTVTYVGNICVDGLIFTKEKVIKREILLNSGDVFSISKLHKSFEQINNLGFIEKVDPQFFQKTNNIVDLFFSITEGKSGMFNIGVGYSSIDKFIGSLQLRHLNMLGLGQKLDFLCEFGLKKQNYQIDWTYPWIFDKNIDITLSIFDINQQKDRDKKDDNTTGDEHRIGGIAKASNRINSYVSLLLAYKYEHINFSRTKLEIEKINVNDNIVGTISSISPGIVYDSRDYIFNPSRGNRQFVGIEIASNLLGGSENFIKGDIVSTWYFHIFWKFVLRVNFEGGIVGSYADQHHLIASEKFYLGGVDSVRGYTYKTEIGPSCGGKVKGLINIEYKFPLIYKENKTVIQGLMFYDVGGVWKNCNSVKLSLGTGSKNLRSGVGFGIRFLNPLFPLRLDWGYGLNHKKGEPLHQFYFNVGNVF